MRNKTKRLLTIRKLIESELISSQEELLFRLKEMNVEATQSTLSRDLKFMKVAKIPHKEKGYIYVIPESIQNEQLIRKSFGYYHRHHTKYRFFGQYGCYQNFARICQCSNRPHRQ